MIEREKLISMVRGLQNGDPDAATKLYETFQSDIYYFILKTVNNDRELAEDLTQDTFIEILETVDKLQEPAAFVTWSKQIAYHKCTAYFRKRKELLADENEDGYSVFDTIEEDREEFIPDAALDHEDLKQTIIKMINDLPEEQKSAILLRYFNEISVKEIADIQGVTEGTVKSRLNYGRKSIKQAVEEYEKKNGIKLHCAGVLPLMLWFFKSYRVKNDLHISSNTAMQSFVIGEESAGAAAIIGSSASATTATATAAVGTTVKAAAAVGGKALATKIIAGIAAAAVAIGGVSIGIASAHSHKKKTEQPVIVTYEANADSSVADQTENICLHEYLYPEFKEDDEYYAIVCDDCGVVLENNVLSCLKGGEHLWQNEYDICDSDGSRQTRRVCVICDREELHTYCADTCNHEWDEFKVVYVTIERIHEETRCKLCGSEIAASDPNTCSHVFDVEPQYDEQGRLTNSPKCTRCNAELAEEQAENTEYDDFVSQQTPDSGNSDISTESPREPTDSNTECEHEMVIVEIIYGAEFVDEWWECTKCGERENAWYPNPWPNECLHEGKLQSDNTMICTICGANLGFNSSEEIPSEVPTEPPTEASTECDHNWESYGELVDENNDIYEWFVCAKCGESRTKYVSSVEDSESPTEAPTETPTEAAECEHNMVMTDQLYGSEYINETWECAKCGELEYVNYPNPCNHEGELRSDYIMVCIHCGMHIGYYPPEETPTEASTEAATE